MGALGFHLCFLLPDSGVRLKASSAPSPMSWEQKQLLDGMAVGLERGDRFRLGCVGLVLGAPLVFAP